MLRHSARQFGLRFRLSPTVKTWTSSRGHLRSDFFGLYEIFHEHARPSLVIFFRPDPFLLRKQHSSLNFLCHVQICIAVGDCFENSLTNACCTVLFDCDRAHSNTHITFYLPVKGISISVRIKTSNFDLFKNMLSK